MKKGKHEAAGDSVWQRGGDPFAEDTASTTRKKETSSVKQAGSAGGWKSWSKGKKGGVIALCSVAALALLGALWWTIFVKPPAIGANDRPGVTNNNPSIGLGEGVDLDGDGEPDDVSGRKDDYYTFLLIGRDTAGGGNTDTLILVSYDVPNGQVNMMSIPRDTAVNVPWTTKKVNSVYNAKESSGGGIEGLKTQVAMLTGVMPDRYVIIEWKAVGRVVKAVGGVEFDVPRNMNYDDPYQDLHIHLNKGMQTLNADQAMAMLRYRKDNKKPDGTIAGYDDIGRMNTQRDFLKAMAKKVLQLGNITKIGEFIDIFMENVETDLTTTEMMWFASKALSVDLSAMQSSTLPYIDVGSYRGGDYLLPNGPEIVPLINEQFNPYNREVQESDLRIIVKNSDGSCYVPGGELRDSKWATPVKSSSGTAGGGVSTTTPTGITANPNVSTGSSGQANASTTEPKPSDEPVLPPDDEPVGEPETAAEPDTTDPDTDTNEPGVATEPEVQPTEGGEIMPEPQPDTDPEPELEQQPEPEPEFPPEPELPPE